MNEQLLQFIWLHRYFNTTSLSTTTGESIEIVHHGTLNTHQGPDFIEGKIKIGDTILVGNIELHVNSSAWNLHKHSSDKHYNNIILHVVWNDDQEVRDIADQLLLTLELKDYTSKLMLAHYQQLMQNGIDSIPCGKQIGKISKITWVSWLERLAVERLIFKSQTILDRLNKNNGSWEDTLWQSMAHNFGLPVNAEAFEAMAISVPIRLLAKCSYRPQQVEALLFGQAGLLNVADPSDYAAMLQNEYQYLQHKYALRPIMLPVLFARMRPVNFPTIRLAQLAVLLTHSQQIFSQILDCADVNATRKIFDIAASEYWNTHFSLEEIASKYSPKKIGRQMIDNLLINTVIPLIFAYGTYKKLEDLRSKAVDWLVQIKKEENNITKQWNNIGVQANTALDSQALIQLFKCYCRQKRCLECSIGMKILHT